MFSKLFIIFLSLVVFQFSFAQFSASENFVYSEYYTIEKNIVAGEIRLMSFDLVHKKFPLPSEKYDRLKHFGTWENPKDDNSCMDVRGLILERDSRVKVTLSKTCKVQTGQWYDPYSGADFSSAALIQIDHLVPLKNAYMTGAYEWDDQKRCLYANYMGDKFHLIPVSAHENLSKSDRAPNEFIPSNKEYTCDYLKNWLSTKLIWDLRLTPNEVSGIKQIVKSSGCKEDELVMSDVEYQKQLTYMKDHQDFCD